MTERPRDESEADVDEVANEPGPGDLEGDTELAGDDHSDALADRGDEEPIESATADELGDPNDALPTSGRVPGSVGAGAAGRSGRAGRAARQAAAAAAARTVAPTPSEAAVHIDDRVSVLFVGAIVATFILIFAFGVFLGGYGVFGHRPTPTPVPTAAPTAVPTASPSAPASVAPSASGSPAASPVASPSGASPSAAPSGSPAPSSS